MQSALAAIMSPQPGTSAEDRIHVQQQGKLVGSTPESAARLREAAREFEAVFLGYMLQVMRETISESGLAEGGPGRDIYTELFDQELARSLAGRGALGISEILVRKLSEKYPSLDADAGAAPLQTAPSGPVRSGQPRIDDQVPDFRMPLQAHVSSHYGIRKDPFTHASRFHQGVDLAAPEGMEVKAAGAGRVVFAGYQKGYGNTVVVEHAGGYETRYAHLGALQVKAGEALQREETVGTVGASGRSTGPHLHFEVSRLGERLDPEEVLAG